MVYPLAFHPCKLEISVFIFSDISGPSPPQRASPTLAVRFGHVRIPPVFAIFRFSFFGWLPAVFLDKRKLKFLESKMPSERACFRNGEIYCTVLTVYSWLAFSLHFAGRKSNKCVGTYPSRSISGQRRSEVWQEKGFALSRRELLLCRSVVLCQRSNLSLIHISEPTRPY